MKCKIEYGMCDGETLRPHHKSPLEAESLYEAVCKIKQVYRFDRFCWQASPSKYLMESDESLYDMIEIIPDDPNKRAVCLRLPYEMTKQDIDRQLPND